MTKNSLLDRSEKVNVIPPNVGRGRFLWYDFKDLIDKMEVGEVRRILYATMREMTTCKQSLVYHAIKKKIKKNFIIATRQEGKKRYALYIKKINV